MSNTLLQNNKLPANPLVPSKEKLVDITVSRIKNLSLETFKTLIKAQREGINDVWHNPKLTPQEVIDGLGDKAIKVFQFHGGLTDYIKAIAAADGVEVDVKYPTNAFTIDQDGKITVTNDPYVIP